MTAGGSGVRPELLVVLNAGAGSTGGVAVQPALALLGDSADVEVVECHSPDEIDGLLAGRGGRTVVLAGGDGSLHNLVATLRRRGELDPGDPLGLLPVGTGNDLARSLGLPLDPVAAARVVLTGRPTPLELLVDERGGVVVNVVHVGVGAEAAEVASELKPRLGAVAYPVGALAAGVRASGWRLRVEVDGASFWDGEQPVLMVGLGLGTSIGGGAPITPDARPADGLVDVVVATATGPLSRLGFALDLRSGEHVDREDVLTTRGREVRITGEPFPVNTDGELEGDVRARTWRVQPDAWSVLTPVRDSPAG